MPNMKKEEFLEKFMNDEYPNAGFLRRWWERKKMEIWLKLPSGKKNETNGDFIKQIPHDPHA